MCGLYYDQHQVWMVTVVVTLPDTLPCVLRGEVGPMGKGSSSPECWRNIKRYRISRRLCHSISCYISATISLTRRKQREVAMRTASIIAVGFVRWAAWLGVAKLLASSHPSSMITATVAFVVIWSVAAAANMWIGMSQAGIRVEKGYRFSC